MPELADFPAAQFIEFSWGDKDYFPDPQSGVFAAIKAALWSGGSVMHLVGFSGTVDNFYRGAAITELRLNPPAYSRMVDYINETFAREKSLGRARAAPGLFPDSRFYPASRSFSLLRTCNTWVAEALEQAGLPISSGLVITAGNLQSQLLAAQRGTLSDVVCRKHFIRMAARLRCLLASACVARRCEEWCYTVWVMTSRGYF